jgi:NTP pyrophosphatase (non-canonical NTP hydrolase)
MMIMDYNGPAQEICLYLDEIQQLLLEMETEVNNLFSCPPDEIEVSNERITKYREIIDEVFEDIDAVCAEDPDGLLKKAVHPRTNRSDIPDELADVFEKRQEINAVAFRINDIIPMVEKRLRKSMEKTLEEIKQHNSSQSAQASKYYNAVGGDTTVRHFSQKNRSI